MNRKELIKHLNLRGYGVEIGVWKGEFSNYILENSNLKLLYSVDAWNTQYIRHHNQQDIINSYENAKLILSKFGKRSQIINKSSENAASTFLNQYFNFIYIDASHDYYNVKKDINLWWDKLKYGGIFSGHDYYQIDNYGVIQAVNEFATAKNLKINLTEEKYKTWWLYKNIKLLN